ncbi:MAG: N-6 DNA methylase, partial [Planctomycetales bacterium]|nr:N-6 DNA methylase [Planctomycetales bacterium]
MFFTTARQRGLLRTLGAATRRLAAVVAAGEIADPAATDVLKNLASAAAPSENAAAVAADRFAQAVAGAAVTTRRLSQGDARLNRAALRFAHGNPVAAAVIQAMDPDGWASPAARDMASQVRIAADACAAAMEAAPGAARWSLDGPEVHFFEHFLAAIDAPTRRRLGVYYTPAAVARRLASAALAAAPTSSEATILDPAMGTGVFLLAVIEVLESQARAHRASGAPSSTPRLAGWELLPGPLVVAHLLLGRRLAAAEDLSPDDLQLSIQLTDALARCA